MESRSDITCTKKFFSKLHSVTCNNQRYKAAKLKQVELKKEVKLRVRNLIAVIIQQVWLYVEYSRLPAFHCFLVST